MVSYVINKTKFVSEEKTQAVLDAIKELNYQPNLYARSLKTNRSMQIAFVCDNLRNDWLEIAEKKLDKLGYNVSHCYSRDGDDFIQSLISGRYDAVFMLSNRYKAVQLNRIAEAGIPVVLYKTREYSHLEPNIVAVAPNLVQRRGKDCQLSGVPRASAHFVCAAAALQYVYHPRLP